MIMVMRFRATIACAFLISLAFSAEVRCADKAPVIEFISPREGETVRGEIAVAATVTPESIVKIVDFYIKEPGAKDRYSWKEFGPQPYVWGGKGQKLDTRLFADGPASAVLYCYTGGQKPAAEKRVNFVIDNGKPVIRIASPADSSSVDGVFPVRVEVNDLKGKRGARGIVAVSVWVDGSLVQRMTKPPFETRVDTCLMTAGLHSVRAVAENSDGLIDSDSVMVIRQTRSGLPGGRTK
jgi:hypothetical protein